ncbi:MAG: (2Fe-2S) ferredoxin domain-containing protein [Cyanobacteria bacterium P01_A01_bin.83]
MTKDNSIVSSFHLSGKLTKVDYQKKKLKYLKLVTKQGKYWIKVPKKLREQVSGLPRGCQLEISGKSKKNKQKGKIQYEAKTVVLLSQKTSTPPVKSKTVSLLPIFDSKLKSKAKVLICQKSNCWKKGGKTVCQELESILGDRGLIGEIPIKKTGCLKQCKKAPALVMMPDKARCNRVKPKQVANLVDKHLIADN